MSKKFKSIVIVMLICCIAIMSVGFGILSSRYIITGNAALADTAGQWNVAIVGVSQENKTGMVVGNVSSFSRDSICFSTSLNADGDSIDYVITVKNSGTLDAKLDQVVTSIESASSSNGGIIYQVIGTDSGDVLLAGGSMKFRVRVSYDESKTTVGYSSRDFQLLLTFVQNV